VTTVIRHLEFSLLPERFASSRFAVELRGLAVHLLSATQGVSVLAHTFHDPGLIEMEAARLMTTLFLSVLELCNPVLNHIEIYGSRLSDPGALLKNALHK
jgi:hypothetical protein